MWAFPKNTNISSASHLSSRGTNKAHITERIWGMFVFSDTNLSVSQMKSPSHKQCSPSAFQVFIILLFWWGTSVLDWCWLPKRHPHLRCWNFTLRSIFKIAYFLSNLTLIKNNELTGIKIAFKNTSPQKCYFLINPVISVTLPVKKQLPVRSFLGFKAASIIFSDNVRNTVNLKNTVISLILT